jgi:hypothetical protein
MVGKIMRKKTITSSDAAYLESRGIDVSTLRIVRLRDGVRDGRDSNDRRTIDLEDIIKMRAAA